MDENVSCLCCGERYPRDSKVCPLCGAENEEYCVEAAQSEISEETVVCPCCGEVYSISLSVCPLCNYTNDFYGDTVDVVSGNNAILIDEESDYVPPKKDRKPIPKQSTPDKNLVLAAFIGVILLILLLFFKAVTGITDRATSKIGVEIFEQTNTSYE